MKFGVVASIPGIGGTITVGNRPIAENKFANIVASLTKVWCSGFNTEKQPKDRCRDLYLFSTATESLNLNITESELLTAAKR